MVRESGAAGGRNGMAGVVAMAGIPNEIAMDYDQSLAFQAGAMAYHVENQLRNGATCACALCGEPLTADDVSALVLVEPEGLKWYIVHHRCGGALAEKMNIRVATSGTAPEGARLQ